MNHKLLQRNDISCSERNPPSALLPLSSQLIRTTSFIHGRSANISHRSSCRYTLAERSRVHLKPQVMQEGKVAADLMTVLNYRGDLCCQENLYKIRVLLKLGPHSSRDYCK